jgi:hypothetical protein
MAATPTGLGPGNDCPGEGQQQMLTTDPSFHQRERPTSTNAQMSDSNKNLVVSPRWVFYSHTDWPSDPSVVTQDSTKVNALSVCLPGLGLNSVPSPIIGHALNLYCSKSFISQHEQKDNFFYMVIRRVITVHLLSCGVWPAWWGKECEPVRGSTSASVSVADIALQLTWNIHYRQLCTYSKITRNTLDQGSYI